MKIFLLSSLLFIQFSAAAQIYIPLKNVNGVATFEASADAGKLTAEQMHQLTLQWMEKTFLSESVTTLDTPERISARFFQDYSDGTWSGRSEHMLQIDIKGNMAFFTITDTKLGLIRSDGSWKDHLSKMKVMFEQAANELFWSYETDLKTAAGEQ